MATPNRFPLPLATSKGKPDWLKVKLPRGEGYERIKGVVREQKLVTV